MPLGCSHTIDGVAESALSINYSPIGVVLQPVNLGGLSRKRAVQVCNAAVTVKSNIGQQPSLCCCINKLVPVTLVLVMHKCSNV